MGSCVSRKRESEAPLEEIRSNMGKLVENTRQMIIVQRHYTDATCDLRRTCQDIVSSIREGNRAFDNHFRGYRLEMVQLRGEIREIGNTCRISAGGLPRLIASQELASDCESVLSSNASQCSRNVDVLQGCGKVLAPATGATDRTLTRDSAIYDSAGYMVVPDQVRRTQEYINMGSSSGLHN